MRVAFNKNRRDVRLTRSPLRARTACADPIQLRLPEHQVACSGVFPETNSRLWPRRFIVDERRQQGTDVIILPPTALGLLAD